MVVPPIAPAPVVPPAPGVLDNLGNHLRQRGRMYVGLGAIGASLGGLYRIVENTALNIVGKGYSIDYETPMPGSTSGSITTDIPNVSTGFDKVPEGMLAGGYEGLYLVSTGFTGPLYVNGLGRLTNRGVDNSLGGLASMLPFAYATSGAISAAENLAGRTLPSISSDPFVRTLVERPAILMAPALISLGVAYRNEIGAGARAVGRGVRSVAQRYGTANRRVYTSVRNWIYSRSVASGSSPRMSRFTAAITGGYVTGITNYAGVEAGLLGYSAGRGLGLW